MVTGSAKYKVPGGKLISVRLEIGERIEAAKVMGDFFMHPEEAITDIEDALVGLPASASTEQVADLMESVAREKRIEMVGMDSRALAIAVTMAIRNGLESAGA